MTLQKILAGLVAPAFVISVLPATPVQAEPLIWGVQAEQTEFRYGKDTDVFATKNDNFERLENQLRAQVPISTFFDAVGGVRFSSPSTGNRFDGVIGLHGLAPQFFEVDADLFVGEYLSARLDVDYEVLLTNRLIATPTIELNLPFTDDTKYGKAAFGPSLEVGLRLSYDVVDRLLSPYIGIHYERSFGGTANIKRSEGEDAGAVFFLVGAKMIF